MSDLLAARSMMAMSLAFHILFAVVGMAMPLLMVIAEGLWLRTKDPVYEVLARRWAKGTAILFAVGAVSGTALSFELGLLWPTFMEHAGPIIGMPFSLEGFAFFLEAIFLGLYLYGWDRLAPKVHLLMGALVAFFGTASGVLVVAANAWMNTPQGFDVLHEGRLLQIHSPSDWPAGLSLLDVEVVDVRPWEAMFNPAFPTQALHMALAAFATVGIAVAGVHAAMLLKDRDNRFHRAAFTIAIVVGGLFSALMPLSGDIAAKHLAHHQPVKLAAMEAHWHTETCAPLILGGIPDMEAEETNFALRIPCALSFLAFADFDAEVMGLVEVPEDERPNVPIVHFAFQIMVACGTAMVGLAALIGFFWWRGTKPWDAPWLLRLSALAAPLGFIAVEAGWFVTEVGRQPWIARGMLRTSEAVTTMPHLTVPLTVFTILYAVLGVVVVTLLRYIVFRSPSIPVTDDVAADPTPEAHDVRH